VFIILIVEEKDTSNEMLTTCTAIVNNCQDG